MNKKKARKLALIIVKDLFTDGSNVVAQRLVMEPNGKRVTGSGWSQRVMRDRIETMLRK
jgi:hypothetical protein